MTNADPTLKAILAEIKKTNGKLDKIDKRLVSVEAAIKGLDKRLISVEKDIKRVLECVPVENADEFPRVKRSSAVSRLPMAAKNR